LKEDRIDRTLEDEIDLRDLLRTLWKYKYAIIGVTVLAMLLAGLISKFCIAPVYEATAVVEIEPLPPMLQELPQRSITSYQNLVTSDRVLETVIKKLKLDEYYASKIQREEHLIETLREEHIKTEVPSNANLIEITVNDKNPDQAARMANEIAITLVEWVKKDQRKQLDNLIKFVEDQIAQEEQIMEDEVRLNQHKLTGGSVEAIMADSKVLRQQTILANLEQKLSNLKNIKASGVIGSNIAIVNKGIPNKEPVSPNTLLNVVVVGTLGLMFSVFGVFFREYMMR